MGELVHVDFSARDAKGEEIVRWHVGYSMLGGTVPVPLLDIAAITAVQLDMLKQLARNYRVDVDVRSARAFLTSLSGALGGTMAARLGASVVKVVPGIGWAAGGAAQLVFTGASTYAIGQLLKRLFRDGKGLEELSLELVRAELQRYFERGRSYVESVLAQPRPEDVAETLFETLLQVERLHDAEELDAHRFAEQRSEILRRLETLLATTGAIDPEDRRRLFLRLDEMVRKSVLESATVERLRELGGDVDEG
jgi:uncharacterized protein (DUF697 family)